MKRAWVYQVDYAPKSKVAGDIERISDVEDWPIYLVNDGTVVPVDFDETVIDPDYVLTAWVDDAWELSEDTAQKNADAAAAVTDKAIRVEEMRIDYGIKTKAFLGYLCEQNGYTSTEYNQLLADVDLQLIDKLLLNGALETCSALLTAYTPTAYFTAGMKTDLGAKLTEFIGYVDAFIAS